MNTKGFTLIEMLIVIVIIGILSAALLPRVMGLQARARDTAREVDAHNISLAVELYAFDNGEYPDLLEFELASELGYNQPTFVAFAGDPSRDEAILLSARINPPEDDPDLEECTDRLCSLSSDDENIGTVGSQEFQKAMEGYINKIPMDIGNGLSTQGSRGSLGLEQAGDMPLEEGGNPGGGTTAVGGLNPGGMGNPGGGTVQNGGGGFNAASGLVVNPGGGLNPGGAALNTAGCSQQGDYFAYSSQGSMFVITSLKESKKGNTDNCYGNKPEVDSTSMGLYQTLIHRNGKEISPQAVLKMLE